MSLSPTGRTALSLGGVGGDKQEDFRVRVMRADGTQKRTIARGSHGDWGRGVPFR